MVLRDTVAIDGPVASGKTAVGRLLSQRLGYRFLDTGLMYRAITWMAIEQGISPHEKEALAQLTEKVTFQVDWSNGERILANNRDLSPYLRRPRVEQAVSLVSQVAAVRTALVRQQRAIAEGGRMVMAGRDIGTVVLPDAQWKLFLTASPQIRARRRYAELLSQGKQATHEQVLKEVENRDRLDSQRAIAPLVPATDAVIVDTDGLTVEQVVDKALSLMGK